MERERERERERETDRQTEFNYLPNYGVDLSSVFRPDYRFTYES